MHATPRTARRGFTLVELLVVVAIIGLISAVALPVVLPALNERRVSEAARLLQAVLAGARDAAIRANAPRGIRLLPDPVLNPNGIGPAGVLSSNRIIPIETAPDYEEGLVYLSTNSSGQLVIQEAKTETVGGVSVPSNPTSWYWNIRQGDKIRFNDSGAYYTIAGPMTIGPHADASASANKTSANPERFINNGPPSLSTTAQYLIVVNGMDDDNDGFIDDSFDGLDNDGDKIVDPAFNGLDDDSDGVIDNETASTWGEFEIEKYDGSQVANSTTPVTYKIIRRPVVSPGARETVLPAGVVIDMTTWNAPMASTSAGPILQPERSRLPIDPYTFYVDIMVSPTGQVVQGGAGSSNGDFNSLAPSANQPFYHFWLCDRESVMSPLWGLQSFANTSKTTVTVPKLNPNYGGTTTSQNYLLPMPKGTPNYSGPPYLSGERRLVTLFVKTGQIVSNSIEIFNGYDTNVPYYPAQSGIKETQ